VLQADSTRRVAIVGKIGDADVARSMARRVDRDHSVVVPHVNRVIKLTKVSRMTRVAYHISRAQIWSLHIHG